MGDNANPLMGWTPPGFDLQEELRKKQLAMQLQNAPTSSPIQSSTIAPEGGSSRAPWATQYKPDALNLQPDISNLEDLSKQARTQDLAPYKAAAAAYGAPLQIPRAGDYPRNKVLTALLAPLMFKQILRNPQAGIEGLNVLTRKGYSAAEQKYTQDITDRQRNYQVQTALVNQNNKILMDQLTASKNAISAKVAVNDANMRAQKFDPEMKLLWMNVAKAQREAELQNAPNIDFRNPMAVRHIVNGKEVTDNAYIQAFPGGKHFEYMLPNGQLIEQSTVSGVSPIDSASLASDMRHRLFSDAIEQYKITHEGHSPVGEDLKKLATSVEDTLAEPQDRRMVAVANRENFNRIAKDFDQKANAIGKPIDLELGSIRSLNTALSKSDANGVAANMSVIEAVTAMAGGMRPISRYNKAEVDRILQASGGIEGIRTTIDHWLASGGLASGVPQETLKQIKELADIMKKELMFQQKTIDKYRTEINKAGIKTDAASVADINERLDNELNAGPPMSLEEAAKARGIIK